MRRPAPIRRVAGQPVVTLALVLVSLFALYVCVVAPGGWPLAIVPVVTLWWVIKANSAVAEYKAWKRAWDGMGPGGTPRELAERPALKWMMLALIVAVVALYLAANQDQPGYRFGLLWMGGVVALVVLVGLSRLVRLLAGAIVWPRRQGSKAAVVSICVRRALVKVPDLSGAYRALPEHCWKVLKAGRR